jgi:hypothetical protein
MADSALAVVLRECKATGSEDGWCVARSKTCFRKLLWNGKNFGEICSLSSEDDLGSGRFQERGRTITEQLRSIGSHQLGEILAENLAVIRAYRDASLQHNSPFPAIPLSGKNVVVNYLVHHLTALHCAERSAGQNNGQWLEVALAYEAVAEGYLLDAFAAGHLLVRRSDPLAFLHPRNTKVAHDYYNNEGAYVIDSRGDVWLTFGDRLFEWYEPTFEHGFKALTSSLRELFLVHYASAESTDIPDSLTMLFDRGTKGMTIPAIVRRWTAPYDLKDYYEVLQMPTLMRLPVPISATWSLRPGIDDSRRERVHYPQVRESGEDPGFRDPDEDNIDQEFIYPAQALPPWLLPEGWIPPDSLHGHHFSDLSAGRRNSLAEDLIKHDGSVASVRFEQERYIPPSYWGLLLTCGGGYRAYKGSTSGVAMVGLGYSPEIAVLSDVPIVDRLSAEASYTHFLGSGSPGLLSVSGGLSFNTGMKPYRLGTGKPFRPVDYIRIEWGHAWGVREATRSHGALISVSLESSTIPLGFTYAGLTIRPKFSWMFFDETMTGASVEVVLQ